MNLKEIAKNKGVLIGAAGVAAFGLGHLYNRLRSPSEQPAIVSPERVSPERIQLEERIELVQIDQEIGTLLRERGDTTAVVKQIFFDEPSQILKQSPDDSVFKKHLLREAALYKRLESQYQVATLTVVSQSELKIGNTFYNLDDPQGRILARSLMAVGLNGVTLDPEYGYSTSGQRIREAKLAVRNIQDVGSRFYYDTERNPFVIDPTYFADFARTMVAIANADKPLPPRVTYNPNLVLLIFDGNANAFKIVGSEDSVNMSILFFPSLAAYYRDKDPELFQNYQDVLNSESSFRQRSLLRLSGLISPDTPEGLFIDHFSSYMEDGAKFRQRMLYAQVKGFTGEYRTLQSAYNLFKDWFRGTEFAGKGLAKEVEDFTRGEIITIDDWKKPAGVILRPTATLEMDPDWPGVYDGASVMVHAGPEIAVDEEKRRAARMYFVEQGSLWPMYSLRGFSQERYWMIYPDRWGWVPDTYLKKQARG